jgi:hypothetical protein
VNVLTLSSVANLVTSNGLRADADKLLMLQLSRSRQARLSPAYLVHRRSGLTPCHDLIIMPRQSSCHVMSLAGGQDRPHATPPCVHTPGHIAAAGK